MVTGATLSTDSDELLIEARGDGLAAVTTVHLIDDDDLVSGAMTIVARTSESVTARRSGASGLTKGRIEFHDSLGRMDAVEVPPTERDAAPLGAQDQLVIRFVPGVVEPPLGRTGGALLEQRFSSSAIRDSLAACGVLRLDRLFPWFRREDVYSRNLIGEGIILEDLSDTHVASVSPGIDQLATCARLSKVPGILSTGVDPLLPALHQPDPLWPDQWGLQNTGQTICTRQAVTDIDINPESAWIRTRGSGAQMAIIDAGTDGHPDITGCDPCTPACPWPSCGARPDTSFVPGDFTYNDSTASRHGNAVASLAMAHSDNGTCIAGVAEDATTWAIKVIDRNLQTTASRVAGAIDYARRKNRGIMNLSLGFTDAVFSPTFGTKQALADACLNAFYTGYLMVASSGNDNDSTSRHYPAAFGKRVCAVGASDLYGERWTDQAYNGSALVGSSYGSWTDLIAPGGRFIVSAWANQQIDRCHDLSNCNLAAGSHFGGTSAAAPLVTGVAALLKAYNPNLLGEDIEQIMIRNARDVASPSPAAPGFDVATGYGIVQAGAALDYITPPRYIRQRSVGFEGTSGTMAFADSSDTLIRLFNLPGVSNLPRPATRVRLAGTGSFGGGYQGPPTVWVRSSGTLGWDSLATFDFYQDVRWGRVKSGTLTAMSASFETFVYRVGGTAQLWFPCRPESARVAFTTVGSVDTLAVAVGPQDGISLDMKLGPNPTVGNLTIAFRTLERCRARLDILDVAGRVVGTLVDRDLDSGSHRFLWDGRSNAGEKVAGGVYVCRLKATGRQDVRKFAFVSSSVR